MPIDPYARAASCLALLLAAASPLFAANPIFFEDFESGDTSNWSALYVKGSGAEHRIDRSRRWSGNLSAKVAFTKSSGTVAMEASFTPQPRIYVRFGLYIEPGLKLPPGAWIALGGPANTWVGTLDRVLLMRRQNGDLIISSQSCGDGTTVVQPGQWMSIEMMFTPGDGTGQAGFWVNGILQRVRAGLPLKTEANSILLGALQFSWASSIDATLHFDDVTVASTLSGTLQPGCTLHLPELRGRAGARLQAILTGWQAGDKFSASLTDSAGVARKIHETELSSEGAFHFPIQLSSLARGTHQITASLQDSHGAPRAQWSRSFEKNYDHEARLTVDSDNNVRLDGRPFFPVTPFGLPEHLVKTWVENGYVNCLYGQNWWKPTTQTMRAYAAQGASLGVPTFGPLNMADQSARNTGLVTDYVNDARNDANIVGYTFLDEPDYNGTPPQDVREWWQTAKRLDGSRLVHLNFMGSDFIGTGAHLKIGKAWTYPNLFADIYGFDLYPLQRPSFTFNSLAAAADMLDKMNRGLVPFFAFVQTCNVDTANAESRAPTGPEVRLMAWLLVLHQARGIQWYHYGGPTSPECYAAMATFTSEITALTPVVSSTLPAPAVACSLPGGAPAPLHAMSRQFGEKTYVFLANPTSSSVSFRCLLPGVVSGDRLKVFRSDGTLACGDGHFEDTLPGLAVRIYHTRP